MPTRKENTIEKKQQTPNSQPPAKEIHRKIDYGSNKIRLILQFPSESSSSSANILRQEILTILSRELSGKVLP